MTRKTPAKFCLLLLVWLSAQTLFALTNNLVLTPPMGWNDWNTFHCGLSETLIKQTADAMATNGMKAAGYQFINLDDGWAASRDANGVIVADTTKFPSGMKALADYVHGKGLKFGVYTDHGTNTCSKCIDTGLNPVGKSPGSIGYEYVDAMTYASYGVDYLKNDSCNKPAGDIPHDDYFRMMDGLAKCGRPIVVSICENGEHYEYWSPDLGNLWRTTGDIGNTFASMQSKIDPNSKAAYLAGPGQWNDADMMEVGFGEFTNLAPAQAHFTMWCIMAAPLLAGNDIRSASAQTISILTNPEAIAVDQDPAGEQGVKVGGISGTAEVWSKPLGYDFTTRAVALLNRTTSATNITCVWTNLGLQPGSATVRDLWAHADLGTFTDSFTTNVPAQGALFLKIVGTPLAPPGIGTNYLSDLQPIYVYTGFGTLIKDKSIGNNTLTLAGTTYSKGIGTHAIGGHEYNLGGVASRFQASIGVDDEVGSAGSVIFQVYADGMKIYDSGIMTGSSATKTVDLDVTGVTRLTLGVTDTGNDVTGSRNSNDHSDWAAARVVVTNTTPVGPSSPTGLSAVGGNSINLSWGPVRSAVDYNIKRATFVGGPYTNIAVTHATIFADTNVVLGGSYYYELSATNRFGESSNSVPVTATACSLPGTPTNLVTTPSDSQVVVRWNAAAGATSYTVSRFQSDTPPVVIATGVATTNYTDTTALDAKIYFYIVAANNACGQSAFSFFAAAAMPLPPSTTSYWTNTVTTAAQNWNVNGNWTNVSAYPNSAGAAAIINANIAGNQTINLNVPITVGSIAIGDTNGSGAYTINGNGGSLAFNNGTSAALLTQVATSKGDTIAAPVTVATNLTIANNSTNALTFAGNVSGAGLTLSGGTVKAGDGTTNGLLAFSTIADQGALIFQRSDNITNPAVISGAGSVTQNGAGILTLSGANSFSGGVTVAQGTLKVGVSGALGATNGGTTIQSGATLDVNAISLGGEPVIVSGTGVNNQGAIYNSGGQVTSGLRFVTLVGETWFGGTGPWNPGNNQGRWDIRGTNGNVVSATLSTGGQPYKIVKTGSNQVSMVAVSVDPQLGDIDIQQGLMGWETVTTSMGNPASNLIVRAGATLSFFNCVTVWDKHFVFYGNGVVATVTNWSGPNTIVGPVQLNGDCIFSGGGTSLTLGNVVSGTGNLIKNGGYTLILSNVNNYAGDTTINSGTLSLAGNGSIGSSPNITTGAGATLNVSARSDAKLTLVAGQALKGNGSLTGDVQVGPGSVVAPGGSLGMLTVIGVATLRGTTFIELNETAHTNDVLNAASINYGGALVLTNLSGTLVAGDSFRLFNAGVYTGGFTNITPAIPGLNLSWNTNGLTNGVLSVVVSPTPPPSFGIGMSGGGVVFSGSNGVPGWPYYLWASTNAGLPISNWVLVMSNWFDGNGNFLFTNGIGSNGPQQFFIIQLP